MQKKVKVLLTTTDSLEGYCIKKYFNIISARVVVGAGLGSEIFAGLTDLFGGRSGKFEERLSELYCEGMNAIEKKAMDIGADAVIGVKADIDEISGKQMMMFMITITGTPVCIQRLTKINDDQENSQEISYQENNEEISYNDIERKILMNRSIDELRQAVIFEDLYEIIDRLIKKRVLLPAKVLLYVINQLAITSQYYSFHGTKIAEYFSYYDSKEITKELNEFIAHTEKLASPIHEVYSTFAYPDYQAILSLLRTVEKKSWATLLVPVLVKNKDFYNLGDAQIIEEIIAVLSTYKNEVVEVEKNSIKADKWVCVCGYKNSLKYTNCQSCLRYRTGLSQAETREIEDAIVSLTFLSKSIRELANC